jgi:hypothetical protein
MRKKDINEIIDGDDNLIGTETTPPTGANKETMANNTTDYNAKVHGQNFKNDFLGRFGFFGFESEEDIKDVKEKIAKMMYGKYLQSLDYYHSNPDKLKSDYELHLSGGNIDFSGNMKDVDHEWADAIMKVVKPHMKDQIDEGQVSEEKILDKDRKKKKDALKKEKDDDHELNYKAKRVADLIDKLPEKDKKKIKAILEQ